MGDAFKAAIGTFDIWRTSVEPSKIALCAVFVLVVFLLRKAIAGFCVGATHALLRRFSVELSDVVLSQIRSAAEVFVVTFALYVSLEFISLPPVADTFLRRLLSSVAVVAVFGTWYQLSGPFASLLRSDGPGALQLETDWILRATRFAVVLFGLTSLLKVWQVDISAALTGVGVFGAGMAIATQDLLRNLIAGMTNISENRFETGDAVRVDGQFIGTVKQIDLRSTLVVGFDQIPRHIPNSDLSNSVVMNYSRMEHRRVRLKVPLVLSTTQAQAEAVRDALRSYLKKSSDFDQREDAPRYVYFAELGPSSIDVLFHARTSGPVYADYLATMERLTLEILRITNATGAKLAYPAQTIRMEDDPRSFPADTDQSKASQ